MAKDDESSTYLILLNSMIEGEYWQFSISHRTFILTFLHPHDHKIMEREDLFQFNYSYG